MVATAISFCFLLFYWYFIFPSSGINKVQRWLYLFILQVFLALRYFPYRDKMRQKRSHNITKNHIKKSATQKSLSLSHVCFDQEKTHKVHLHVEPTRQHSLAMMPPIFITITKPSYSLKSLYLPNSIATT